MSDVPCFVGIDVTKAHLDIALRPSGSGGPFRTMPAGWRRLWTGCRPSSQPALFWKPRAA